MVAAFCGFGAFSAQRCRNRGMQKQQATIRPQKNQESTQRPNRMPSPKQSIQQLCKSLLRHIWFPPYQKSCREFLSSFCVMKHSMQHGGILNQPPR